LRKSLAIGLVGILLLPVLGYIPFQNAEAQERYTSLTYDGQIQFSYENVLNQIQTVTGTVQITFSIILKEPRPGSRDDIQGRVTAQGAFTAIYPGVPNSERGCTWSITITATFTTDITGYTSVQAEKVRVSGDGFLSNYRYTASGPSQCYTDQRAEIGNILYDCFGGNNGRYTNQACREFPIQGGSNTITKGTSAFTRVTTGTASLVLKDSKKVEPFDFSIEVTPPEIKVYKGGTAAYAVAVSTIKGNAVQVTLSAPNVEGLGRLAFDRTTGTPPFNAKLTVPAGQANPGRYPLQVVGRAGELRKTTTATLIVEDCPRFAITPTMPAANDPREFTTPNGKASFRFDIEWGGKLPMSVTPSTAGVVGGAIQAGFAFNPVQILNNKVNIIMEVTTTAAGVGNYPIAVTAGINDPELPVDCSRVTTNVILVVGESRAQDLPLLPRPNPPPPPQPNPPPQQNNPPQRPAQIAPIKIIEQRGNVTVKGNLVQTGTDGKAKLPEGPIFLDVNKDTKVWRINWDDLDEGIDDLVAEELNARPLAICILSKLH